jgi:hypothetical protein
MRTFFLLLVLANLAFFAWDRYLRAPLSAGERIEQVQITPEKIRLINTRVPPVTPAAVCMEWGAFAGAAVARADAALEELALPAAQVTRVVMDASGYWVYIAPLKSKGDVDKAGRALKGFGVTDYSVVQDQTQWRNAISLGIFRTDEAAQAFLASLKKKGVTDAVAEKRENFLKQVVFYVREPSEATVARLAAIRATLPASEVRAVPCPS